MFKTKEFDFVHESLKDIIEVDMDSSFELSPYEDFFSCIPTEDIEALLKAQSIIRDEKAGKVRRAKSHLALFKKIYSTKGRMIFNILQSGILKNIVLKEWEAITEKYKSSPVRCKYFTEHWRNVLGNPMYINGLFVGSQSKGEIYGTLHKAFKRLKKQFFSFWTRKESNMKRVEKILTSWIQENEMPLEIIRVDMNVVGEPAATYLVINIDLIDN